MLWNGSTHSKNDVWKCPYMGISLINAHPMMLFVSVLAAMYHHYPEGLRAAISHISIPSLCIQDSSQFSNFSFSCCIYNTQQWLWLRDFHTYFIKIKLVIFWIKEVVCVHYNEPVNAAMSEYTMHVPRRSSLLGVNSSRWLCSMFGAWLLFTFLMSL